MRVLNNIFSRHLILLLLLWVGICPSQNNQIYIPPPPCYPLCNLDFDLNPYSPSTKEADEDPYEPKEYIFESYRVFEIGPDNNRVIKGTSIVGDTIVLVDTESEYILKLRFVGIMVYTSSEANETKGVKRDVMLLIELIDKRFNGWAEVNYDRDDMFIAFIPENPCVYENKLCASCSTPRMLDTMSLESFSYLTAKCVSYVEFRNPRGYPLVTRFATSMKSEKTVEPLKQLFKSGKDLIEFVVLGYRDMDDEAHVLLFKLSAYQSYALYQDYIRCRRFTSIFHRKQTDN